MKYGVQHILLQSGSLFLLVSCSVARKPETVEAPTQTQEEEAAVYRDASATISFYDNKLSGRKTASGEKYDPQKATAAHKNLPFGTKVRVTNPETNQAVTVRINDRGPYVKGRDLDVSQSAAQALGIQKQGVKKVKMKVLTHGREEELAPPATPLPEPGLTPVVGQ